MTGKKLFRKKPAVTSLKKGGMPADEQYPSAFSLLIEFQIQIIWRFP